MSRKVATGITTVFSPDRPECHAPSGFTVRDYSGSCPCATCKDFRKAGGEGRGPGCKGTTPRDVQRSAILAFWESQGVARATCNECHGVDLTPTGMCRACRVYRVRWEVRDVVNGGGEWLPLAAQGEDGRGDRAEFSHVRSARRGGAWCACNLLPEAGNTNAARGSADIDALSMAARALLAAWPAWWTANRARKASLSRLA